MKLNSNAMGMSFAAAFAILWIFGSLLVMILPSFMMNMTGHMAHENLNDMGWAFTFTGFMFGLVAWAVTAGAIGWLVGFFYNKVAN